MSQEIEIEFKNLLTKDEFELLMKSYHVSPSDFIAQENHYFDTLHFSLKAQNSALRIRKKQDMYILTLKQPHEQGLLETHQKLSKEEASLLLYNTTIQLSEGPVYHTIKQMGIDPGHLKYLGTLKTDRVEIKDGENLLVLDHSFYLDHEDFELEYEVKNPIEGKEKFLEILKQNNIPIRDTKNKISRFFERKQKKEENNENKW